jgi:hypothetical protein
MELTHEQKISRIAKLELAMELMQNEANRRVAEANTQAARDAYAAHIAAQAKQVEAAKPAPATDPRFTPPPADAPMVGFGSSKIVDSYVTSPGANVRAR